MVASFYGMNVALPLAGSPNAFAIILAISVVLSLGGVLILRRMKMF
ncbi:MAG: CorA family divalent cation transporter [Bacillota bacterium]|jgi:LPXTG-motif cell wall-anchored protein|nr:LPXTG cell wall anchor domain-containing protein [Bacillota bacterium]